MPLVRNFELARCAITTGEAISRRGFFMRLLPMVLFFNLALQAFAEPNAFNVEPLPAPPGEANFVAVGSHGNTLIGIDTSGQLYVLPGQIDAAWMPAGQYSGSSEGTKAISTEMGVVVVHPGTDHAVLLIANGGNNVLIKDLPAYPNVMTEPLITAVDSTLFLLSRAEEQSAYHLYRLDLAENDGPGRGWEKQEKLTLNAPLLTEGLMLNFQQRLYAFGKDAQGKSRGYRLELDGPDWDWHWKPATPPPSWGRASTAVTFGEAHVFMSTHVEGSNHLYAYHTITDRWVEYGLPQQATRGTPHLTKRDGVPVLVTDDFAAVLPPRSIPPRFRALDYVIVAIYLLGMIGIGAWFTRRENTTDDFFRGGRRVPWWASGMSLFATLSSAISLMSMPRMGYASNWTFFAIGIGELIALPIAVWFLVPLVRRLNIETSNEYLERRFGVVARLLGSTIFILMQVGGRMAPVMLLPAIALEAITGIHVIYFILVMGLITTIYTYLGGLEAVIWTDTIQGFVMVGTIVACLVIVFIKLNTPSDVVIDSLMTEEKLKTFEQRWSLVYPTMWMFLIYSITTTVMRLADQNFVQRVQCTPTLKQAKLAVCTQLGVAIPLNLLLFAVGTALWLFYRDNPDLVDPTIKTDSIYPYFAAQQMPLGIAGLIVAALLAATMSTISSSICSVSDLCVSDFYKRFTKNANDHTSLLIGRSLTAIIGVLGTGAAIGLSMMSGWNVWELSILIINTISLGIAGLFLSGLLTTRVNQVGAVSGFVAAILAIVYIREYVRIDGQQVNFFLYTFIGSVVTFVVGYVVSLLVPGKSRNLEGLTVYTLTDQLDAED